MPRKKAFDFNQEICFRPIGFVHSQFEQGQSRKAMEESRSRIVVHKKWTPGLEGLESGQSIWVIFYFHRAAEERPLRQHPRGDTSRPKRGIFSLRSPSRPNGIGITRVTLVEKEPSLLVVRGLDAYDQTPVLDLKPA